MSAVCAIARVLKGGSQTAKAECLTYITAGMRSSNGRYSETGLHTVHDIAWLRSSNGRCSETGLYTVHDVAWLRSPNGRYSETGLYTVHDIAWLRSPLLLLKSERLS